MRIDVSKLDLALARRCMSLRNLRSNISSQTLTRIRKGDDITPRTLGRIAEALGVDPADIIDKGGERL